MKTISDLEGYPKSIVERAYKSIESILSFNGIDHSDMSGDEMQAAARKISAPCHHSYKAPYKSGVERQCCKCGGIQSN